MLESYDTGIRRCVVCTRRYTSRAVALRGHGWCDCGGGLEYVAALDPNPRANHDPGDEDRT